MPRYARVAHPDVLERDVLPKAAELIRKLAEQYTDRPASNPEVRLVGAAESWYLGGNDKRVLFIPMMSEASARVAKLWNAEAGDFDTPTVKAGAKQLTGKRAGLPPGGGYTCAVNPATLHGTTAADLLECPERVVEMPFDPLA